MKLRAWSRDELLLVLEAYFRIDKGKIDARDSDVLELHKALNQLPYNASSPRSANAVALKLANFRALDANEKATGMKNYSSADQAIWNEFSKKIRLLTETAQAIMEVAPLILLEGQPEYVEGGILYTMHRRIERSSRLAEDKKKAVLKNAGKLECEICGFDFAKTYGEIGSGFIEVHHIIPLSRLNRAIKTSVNNVSLVCANCHRILHRMKPEPDIQALKHLFR